MCTDPDGNSLNYLKKAEVHNYDEQRRIQTIPIRIRTHTSLTSLYKENAIA